MENYWVSVWYNFSMKNTKINFAELLKGYTSGWVGISSDFTSVVVNGKTLKDVRSKARRIKEKLYFFPAGESYSDYIGWILE